MADETGSTGDQSTNNAGSQQQAAQEPETGQQQTTDQGAGGKEAVLADLAKERDKRQALETQVAELGQFRDGMAKLFGAKANELTPEQLQAKLTAAETAQATQAKQIAVYQSAPEGVDVKALLDSASFLAVLQAADNKPEATAQAVTDFVKANPRFSTQPSRSAWRDANAKNEQTTDADAEALHILGF